MRSFDSVCVPPDDVGVLRDGRNQQIVVHRAHGSAWRGVSSLPSIRLAMHRDRIAAGGDEWLAVPRRPSLREPEACRRAALVVFGQRQASGRELESGDEDTARRQVPRHVGDDLALAAGCEEDHHVAGGHDHVERPAEIDAAEIGETPIHVRSFGARRREHAVVDVHSHDVDATAREFAADPSGAASGVEDRSGREPPDEVRFAMHVLARGLTALIRGVVGVTGTGALA